MSSEPSFMEQMFRNNFIRADEYSIQIEVEQLPLTNVSTLKNMISRVEDDLDILDADTFKYYKGKKDELLVIYNERTSLWSDFGDSNSEDEIDTNQIRFRCLLEEFRLYKKLLSLIKQIGYKKGWFE